MENPVVLWLRIRHAGWVAADPAAGKGTVMIVVCGEALMDVFATGDTNTGVALDARIGGSPLNVAIGLARLAQPVSYFGAVGRGFLGERLMQALIAEGVDTSAVVRVAASTTLGLVGLDAQGVADYAFYGIGGADRQLSKGDQPPVPSIAAPRSSSNAATSTLSPLAQALSGPSISAPASTRTFAISAWFGTS